MEKRQIMSEEAARVLSPGLGKFLWYLASTTDSPTQEFHLEPGFKTQNIVHQQNPGGPDRAYDITIGRDEIPVSADIVIRQNGDSGTMLLKEEAESDG